MTTTAAKLAEFSRKCSSVVLNYGWERGDFHAEKMEVTPRGTRFDMVTPEGKIADYSPLIGRVNVYNILAAAAACYARGCLVTAISSGIASLTLVFREDLRAWTAANRSRLWSTMRIPTTRCGI